MSPRFTQKFVYLYTSEVNEIDRGKIAERFGQRKHAA